LRQVLEQLRTNGDWVTHVTSWRVLEARAARYGAFPPSLDARLVAMLAAQGIPQLYTHQAEAVALALAGRNVAVVTPTASGKTLCYNLPVLQALLTDPQARALYLFPTKALAHDQLHTLQRYAAALGQGAGVATYDGDTPRGQRTAIRRGARVLLANPDMLHLGIMPYHPPWREFLAHLRYIVVDEMHHYRGIFGSHVANVLRRLARLCRFYGSQPQFITCSATIANPTALAQKLTGGEFALVNENGAPRGERAFIFYNPPLTNPALGLRRSPLLEARALANVLLQHDTQTVLFAPSRLAAELLLTYLRQDAPRASRDPLAIRGYRSGYLPAERRRIEAGLRAGTVRAVVATNALELGVDIGGMAASVLVGYPGTIASAWQQAGRAGRGDDLSAAILIAGDSPADQYIIAHPDYFFGQAPEHALINPDNLYLLYNHLKCATYELPFAEDEHYGTEDVREILRALESEGLLRYGRGAWHWASDRYPAGEISLRTADPQAVLIVEPGGAAEASSPADAPAEQAPASTRVIGQVDRPSAPGLVYEGAVYLHEGQQYLVEGLDWEHGVATVKPVLVDYYTEAMKSHQSAIERVAEEVAHPHFTLARGEVRITTRVTGYRRMRLGSLEHLGWGEVDLPEQQLLTAACWMTLPEELVARLRAEGWWVGEQVASRGPSWPTQRDLARRRDHYHCRWCNAPERPGHQHDVHHLTPFRHFGWIPGENEHHRQANHLDNLITLCPTCHRRAEQQVAVQSTLSGLGRVLGHLIPLLLMCDPHDVGILTEVQSAQTGAPTLFVYDGVPAGVGLSDEVLALFDELLARAAELVRDCPCPSGCPSCVGPSGEERAKQQVLRLIAALRGRAV
jgi:DEAD/DEAH box helicase domain-containing protein